MALACALPNRTLTRDLITAAADLPKLKKSKKSKGKLRDKRESVYFCIVKRKKYKGLKQNKHTLPCRTCVIMLVQTKGVNRLEMDWNHLSPVKIFKEMDPSPYLAPTQILCSGTEPKINKK